MKTCSKLFAAWSVNFLTCGIMDCKTQSLGTLPWIFIHLDGETVHSSMGLGSLMILCSAATALTLNAAKARYLHQTLTEDVDPSSRLCAFCMFTESLIAAKNVYFALTWNCILLISEGKLLSTCLQSPELCGVKIDNKIIVGIFLRRATEENLYLKNLTSSNTFPDRTRRQKTWVVLDREIFWKFGWKLSDIKIKTALYWTPRPHPSASNVTSALPILCHS